MRKRTLLSMLSALALAGVAGAPGLLGHDQPGEGPRAAGAPNPAAIARRIVNDTLAIRPGEAVQLTTDLSDPALVEEVALAIRRAGAFPLIVYDSPRLARRILEETPEPYLAATPEYQIRMLRVVDAAINLAPPAPPDLLARIPEHRLALVRKANEPVAERMQGSPLRSASLGNNGFPSRELARFHNAPYTALEQGFWRAVGVDPAHLRARGERVRAILANANSLVLTAPNGTRLEMRLVGRPILLNDGAADAPRDPGAPPEARQVWLPAGEAYTSPLETSANGVLRIASTDYRGIKIEDLRLMFRDGRVAEMAAQRGGEALREALALAGGDGDRIAVIDVGLNPESRPIPGSTYLSWEMEGVVTVGIGGIDWAPTENRSDFSAAFFLRDATLEADGRAIVKEGRLQI
jgi:leucyl aminopeptidase (aminopeptidase T)